MLVVAMDGDPTIEECTNVGSAFMPTWLNTALSHQIPAARTPQIRQLRHIVKARHQRMI